jgi:hypothetical protein
VARQPEKPPVDERLVADWIRYQVDGGKSSDPQFNPWEDLHELVRSNPEVAWEVTLALVAASPDDRILAMVAAGPLEDLLTETDDAFIDRAEIQARRDAKFRRCLTGVWGLSATARERFAKYVATIKDPL